MKTEKGTVRRDGELDGAYFLDGEAPIYSALSLIFLLLETVNQSNVYGALWLSAPMKSK